MTQAKCTHERHVEGRWVENPFYDAEEDDLGGYGGESHDWDASHNIPTTRDLDLHRYQCTQCNEIMYYSYAAKEFYEKGITCNVMGLEKV